MTKEEYIEELEGIKDPNLREEFAKQYHNDSMADKKVLLAKAQASLGMYEGLKAVADATTVSPLTYAFNESESGLRNLVDPNSPSNWMKVSSDDLLKAAIKGGYVKDVPEFAPEWKKQEKREQFGKFLNMLARESNDQGRRNAVREYEKLKWYDPQKLLNSTLLHTYEKRAKEQALKGKGAASYGDLSADDLGTISADILASSLMGAGAGGIAKAAAGRGLGTYAGLRTGANVAGSDFAAGWLGGAGSVLNRAVNTDEGVRGYEWATEPLLTGALNVVATPAVARKAVQGVGGALGLNGAKVNNIGVRKAIGAANAVADQKYVEPKLAAALQEMEANSGRTVKNSPVSEETQSKINSMFDTLNDGIPDTPGKTYSLYDELQALYEKSGRDTKIMNEYMPNTGSVNFAPSDARFRMELDEKIKDLEYEVGNVAASTVEEQSMKRREAQRTLDYFKNFRDMMDNGLIDAREYLYARNPGKVEAPVSEYVLNRTTVDVPFFELGKHVPQYDLDIMKDYIANANRGMNIAYDNGLATKIKDLMRKYPEFADYVKSQRTLPGSNISLWESLGRTVDDIETPINLLDDIETPINLPMINEVPVGMGRRVYGTDPVNRTIPWTTKDILGAAGYGATDVASDIVKPMVVQSRLTKYDKPDNSMEALDARLKKIRDISENKNRAVEAALSWKYDPSIPEEDQLTAEERNIINRWRAKKLDEAMNWR